MSVLTKLQDAAGPLAAERELHRIDVAVAVHVALDGYDVGASLSPELIEQVAGLRASLTFEFTS